MQTYLAENISLESTVRASQQQSSCNLDGDAVILDTKGNYYYGLETVAARIWQLVQSPIIVRDLIQQICREYDVEQNRCHRDSAEFLAEMLNKNLITIE